MPQPNPRYISTRADVHPRMRPRPPAADRPLSVVWCEDDASLCSFFEALWRVPELVGAWRPHEEDGLHFARNGEEARELVARHEPDLFVTDLYHPGANGLELLREVAGRPRTALGCVSGATLAFESVGWLDFEVMKASNLPRLWVPIARVVGALRNGTYQPHPDRAAFAGG